MPADIRHIVVLMMENRSFDHLLGYLDHPDPKFPNLKGSESNLDAQGNKINVSPGADYTIVPGPGHHHTDALQQLYGETKSDKQNNPDNSGFVLNYEQVCGHEKDHKRENNGPDVMLCMDPKRIPVTATLAREYAVCTRWFSSLPGMTWPNRNYVHAATSDGEVDIVMRFYNNKTIFEHLSDANKSWAVFSDGIPQVAAYRKLWDVPFDGKNNFRKLKDFDKAVKKGSLPSYSFIEPIHFGPKADSMHPEFVGNREHRFLASENLIRRVYEQLTSNQEIWEHTLLVITFDEHGGFYDRVVPPKTIAPDDQRPKKHNFNFDILGFRVPTILVSPWIKAGSIDNTTYDHSSVIATVRKTFCPHLDELTLRDKKAKDVLHNLTLKQPRLGKNIPTIPPPVKTADFDQAATRSRRQRAELDGFQQSLLDLGEMITKERAKDIVRSRSMKGVRAIPPLIPSQPVYVEDLDAYQETVLRSIRGELNERAPAMPMATRGVPKTRGGMPKDVPAKAPKPTAAQIRSFYKEHHAHLLSPKAVDADLDMLLAKPEKVRKRPGNRPQQKKTLRILTEGDSWFALPPITGRSGIVYHLQDMKPKWDFRRLEKSGDELLTMLSGWQKAKLRRCFQEGDFNVMLFSGGGNDVVGADFASLLRPFEPGMGWRDCIINERFENRLEQLRLSYLDLLGLRNDYAPEMPIVINGYDYPIPQDKGILWMGPWMYPYLLEKGIYSGPMQRDIARYSIEQFNVMISTLTKHPEAKSKFHLVPTTGTLTAMDWGDEIHPTNPGFERIALRFIETLKGLGF